MAAVQFSLVNPKGAYIASMKNNGHVISPLNCPIVFIKDTPMIILIYCQSRFLRTMIHKNGSLSSVGAIYVCLDAFITV